MGTQHFKQTIECYLEQRAEYDELFALSYLHPSKNIDDCIKYIINEVRKSGCNGFADDEIYSMAVHYYDELDIVVEDAPNCRVAVNHVVELTDEEKEQAKQDAIKQMQERYIAELTKPNTKPTKSKTTDQSLTLSLF